MMDTELVRSSVRWSCSERWSLMSGMVSSWGSKPAPTSQCVEHPDSRFFPCLCSSSVNDMVRSECGGVVGPPALPLADTSLDVPPRAESLSVESQVMILPTAPPVRRCHTGESVDAFVESRRCERGGAFSVPEDTGEGLLIRVSYQAAAVGRKTGGQERMGRGGEGRKGGRRGWMDVVLDPVL